MSTERLFRSVANRVAGDDRGLPDEGRLPDFTAATEWIGSEPLTAAALRGRVVLVDFWTYTCINWLRTAPYLRAWNAKYASAGLTVVGVHTPEFGFEGESANVVQHVRSLSIDYPVAVDSGYGVWNAFANRYWPALYLADARGRLRFHHFGEGEYAMTEMAIQQLLIEAGAEHVDTELVRVDPHGLEVAADWDSFRSPETYLGYGQSSGFVAEDAHHHDRSHAYARSEALALNEWSLTGEWTVARNAAILDASGGSLSFAFHARDVNLVMSPGRSAGSIPYRVTLDGNPVGADHGTDVSEEGTGLLTEPGTYQLVRQSGPIADRVVELEFEASGAEAYCFTFG